MLRSALPLAAIALMGAGAPVETTIPQLSTVEPGRLELPNLATREALASMRRIPNEVCRDRISKARVENGLPPLGEDNSASPDDPHLIYALDRRQDGCSVMVMKGNPDDIRPLPSAPDGPIRLIPAGKGR